MSSSIFSPIHGPASSTLENKHKAAYQPGCLFNKVRSLVSALILLPATLCLLANAHAGGGGTFELVSTEEALVAASNPSTDDDFQPKSTVGSPVITIISPAMSSGEVSSPINIEVRFESPDNTEIEMQSMRIFYVMLFKKDITERIMEHASIEGTSLIANGAELPEGRHKFIVEISDAKNRKTQQQFSVTVSS